MGMLVLEPILEARQPAGPRGSIRHAGAPTARVLQEGFGPYQALTHAQGLERRFAALARGGEGRFSRCFLIDDFGGAHRRRYTGGRGRRRGARGSSDRSSAPLASRSASGFAALRSRLCLGSLRGSTSEVPLLLALLLLLLASVCCHRSHLPSSAYADDGIPTSRSSASGVNMVLTVAMSFPADPRRPLHIDWGVPPGRPQFDQQPPQRSSLSFPRRSSQLLSFPLTHSRLFFF